jgi:hypothetical protein
MKYEKYHCNSASKNEIDETTRIQEELTPTAFRLVLSADKLNLPLVPSQDYVLQDNKRCYDKILSDWNFSCPGSFCPHLLIVL